MLRRAKSDFGYRPDASLGPCLVLDSRMEVAYQHEAPASECEILTRWRFVLVKTRH
jgi:hypothetical protein